MTSAIYDLPFGRKSGWLSQNAATRVIFGGWQLGGIVNFQTGFPLSPIVTPNPANTTTTARPNLLRDPNLSGSDRTVDRWYDPTAFGTPSQFNFGNSARNVIRAPGLANLDLLIARNFQITERFRVEFRSEMYNAMNSVHFGRPNVTTNSAQAGRITATQIPNRQVQFGLRLVQRKVSSLALRQLRHSPFSILPSQFFCKGRKNGEWRRENEEKQRHN